MWKYPQPVVPSSPQGEETPLKRKLCLPSLREQELFGLVKVQTINVMLGSWKKWA
jgi:hypothetical protein